MMGAMIKNLDKKSTPQETDEDGRFLGKKTEPSIVEPQKDSSPITKSINLLTLAASIVLSWLTPDIP